MELLSHYSYLSFMLLELCFESGLPNLFRVLAGKWFIVLKAISPTGSSNYLWIDISTSIMLKEYVFQLVMSF